MNRQVGSHFEAVKIALQNYRVNVAEACLQYRAERAKARKYAEKFKEEETAFETAIQKPMETARKSIDDAGKALKLEIKRHAAALRSELENHLSEPMDIGFSRHLKTYLDFGIAPSKVEVESMLKMNAGNTCGVRALAALLERTSASTRITYQDPDMFARDVDRLEKFADTMTNPHPDYDYFQDVSELFKGVPWYSIINGEARDTGNATDALSLSLAHADYKSLLAGLDETKGNWMKDISYHLEDVVDEELTKRERHAEERRAEIEGREPQFEEKPEGSTKIESNAVQLARDIGREVAAGKAAAADFPNSCHVK